MGNVDGKLNDDDVQRLQAATPFSASEIKRMYKRFSRLDRANSGSISRAEFLRIPELMSNPLAEHILNTLDADRDKTVDFEEFVKVLSAFSSGGEPGEKLRYIFSVYDQDNDGYLNHNEILSVLRTVSRDQSEEELRNIVAKTISSVDMDGDGKVSFLEFQQLLDQPYQ
eukprot:TRINITY_DN16775_c0_g1_i3.p1 TRINITY_DN16775_c0_g1~~TRINITY_DN16775_c0_g1_i3.p1  ORF type:complete len:169 (+),score=20.61 TRINITY_DN16775_c0_g1_i3:165-671(+)